jgi:type IV secretory pathway VirB2 component (pilin)
MTMADATPTPNTPNTPEPPRAPDGWALACMGILRSEFGRRRTDALDKAMMQLSAEQAWAEDRAEVAQVSGWRRWLEAILGLPIGRVAFGLAMIAVIAGAVWVFYPAGHQPGLIDLATAGCKITDSLEAHWSGAAAQLRTGEILPAGQLRLDSGVVELAFASGARAAVEGPAELNVIDRNTVELRLGKISAEVPRNAVGFTVKAPNATVVDLGTRFGVDAKAKDASEVDVFEGKVRVMQGRDTNAPDNDWNLTKNMAMVLDRRGGATAAAPPESAFPQPSRVVAVHPVNGGFDVVSLAKLGGFPADEGFWTGPAFELTGPAGGVRPAQGGGMLQFFSPPRQDATPVDSVVWQVVDMRGAPQDFITANGTVDLKAWVQFNRVAGDAHSASKFRISIAAFRGPPGDAAALWAKRNETALAYGEKEIITDNNPRTWEKVEAATKISAMADFAVIEVRAIAPKDTPPGIDPFPGHFADLIDAKVCLPLQPSRK